MKSFQRLILAVSLLFVAAGCGDGTASPAALTPTFSPTPTLGGNDEVTPSPSPSPAPTATATLPPTVTPTPEPAWFQTLDASLAVLKYKYALVTRTRAKVYASLQDALTNSPNYGYLPSYPAYVAYNTTEERDGRIFYLVNLGWMAGEDLQPLTPSAFRGIRLTRQVSFRFGWVLAETQSVNMADTPIRTYTRYEIVHEVPAAGQKAGYFAVGADEWLPEASAALVRPQLPEDAGQDCRFIYVNLAEQTLSVYNGCQLVFATLISSGQNARWTFPGRFSILFKVDYNTIKPPPESVSEYYIEGVPYFMTYYGDLGFHGAYWHDNFGTPASHGCINLAPADAKWLFDWARLGERVIISRGE